jgi:hypothetical protein
MIAENARIFADMGIFEIFGKGVGFIEPRNLSLFVLKLCDEGTASMFQGCNLGDYNKYSVITN